MCLPTFRLFHYVSELAERFWLQDFDTNRGCLHDESKHIQSYEFSLEAPDVLCNLEFINFAYAWNRS